MNLSLLKNVKQYEINLQMAPAFRDLDHSASGEAKGKEKMEESNNGKRKEIDKKVLE